MIISKRRVIFGNPSLETYGGYIYIIVSNNTTKKEKDILPKNDTDNDDLMISSDKFDKRLIITNMVAITDVPPDQIPEGLLNLARGYRSSIAHIRIVISDDDDDNDDDKKDDDDDDDDDDYNDDYKEDDKKDGDSSKEEEKTHRDHHHHLTKRKRYLVLLTFSSSQDSNLFVKNMNGKPYNSFERDVIASVHHVVNLESDCDNNNNNDDDNNSQGRKMRNDLSINNVNLQVQGDITNSHHENEQKEKKKSLLMNPFILMSEGRYYDIDSENGNEGDEQSSTYSSPSSLFTEKQNCAVCLEPMDFFSSSIASSLTAKKESISANKKVNSSSNKNNNKDISSQTTTSQKSIFTTVCNHSFHTECLLQCQDSPCPVCRYDHSGLNETLSQCHSCGTTERIYVCLICGVASCFNKPKNNDNSSNSQNLNNQCLNLLPSSSSLSSFDDNNACCTTTIQYNPIIRGGHAQNHYSETLHAYALDTETQHVWDFAGQGYVHRLIENDNDGKIVEVSDPRRSSAMERSLIPELSDTQEGEVLHRKLEGYASEYYTLLKSQLEQQRIYYEGVMENIRHEHKTKSIGNSTAELIAALKQDRNQLQQRCLVLQKKRNKVLGDVVFLKNMNESLEANKEPLKKQIIVLQNQRIETEEMLRRRIPELEEKVKALILELER